MHRVMMLTISPLARLTYIWSVTTGVGTITDGGLFTAGTTTGTFADAVQVSVTSNSIVRQIVRMLPYQMLRYRYERSTETEYSACSIIVGMEKASAISRRSMAN